ncbi:MAG: hypothetical protein ABIR18_03065, partial [Chitinophagaceae bacterium]
LCFEAIFSYRLTVFPVKYFKSDGYRMAHYRLMMVKAKLKLMYTAFVVATLAVFLLLSSCRKEKEKIYQIQGRLLVSSTNPIPVANYTIDFYQSGSPGIPFPAYTLSSSSSAVTDTKGYFKCDFRVGKSSFLFLNGTNSKPVNMEGRANASYSYFSISDIPLSNLGDIYLYKKIDTAIISVSSLMGIEPTDTLEIFYYTFNGFRQKIKSGVTVNPGANNVVIDTIQNVVMSFFSYREKMYSNMINVRQRKGLTPKSVYSSFYNNYQIEPGDEKKRTILLR